MPTDDILQVALLRLHETLGKVEIESARHFYALATIQIRRTLVDLARHHFSIKRGPRYHRSLDSDAIFAFIAKSPQDECVLDWEQWTEFHQIVETLPPNYREPFELAWYHEEKFKEIGEILGLTERTARRRYSLAGDLIKKQLMSRQA